MGKLRRINRKQVKTTVVKKCFRTKNSLVSSAQTSLQEVSNESQPTHTERGVLSRMHSPPLLLAVLAPVARAGAAAAAKMLQFCREFGKGCGANEHFSHFCHLIVLSLSVLFGDGC